MNAKILVVDDDHKLVDLIKLYLHRDGYSVLVAYDGDQALELARQKQPDLIVLDLMLPSIEGLDVCRILRAESAIPIIMVTARTTEADKLSGLDRGADDYITKPFSQRELVARVRAVLRRTHAKADHGPKELCLGDLVLNTIRHEVRRQGALIRLTPKEFKLLETLMREPGRVFTRLQLLERVFGFDYEGLERTVDVHVTNLRKKIEPDPLRPIYIRTVYGVGYACGEGDDDA